MFMQNILEINSTNGYTIITLYIAINHFECLLLIGRGVVKRLSCFYRHTYIYNVGIFYFFSILYNKCINITL